MRRQYAGAAFASVLTAELAASAGALTITCNDLTNWPDGAVGPFYVVVDRGLATEEKILCLSRTANTLTVYDSGGVNGRGADGTSIQAHGINAVVEHVFTATDADEANLHVNDGTTNVHPQYVLASAAAPVGGGSDHVFWENGITVTANYTIGSGKNAGTFGPVTIDSGVTVTVPIGSTWTVV